MISIIYNVRADLLARIHKKYVVVSYEQTKQTKQTNLEKLGLFDDTNEVLVYLDSQNGNAGQRRKATVISESGLAPHWGQIP